MNTYIDVSLLNASVLPRSSSFQESFDLFVEEFSPGFNRFNGRTGDSWEDDYSVTSERDEIAFTKEMPAEVWEWD